MKACFRVVMENFNEALLQQRSVIKFLTLEGVSAKDIHSRLQNQFGEDTLCYTQVKDWAAQFKRGRISVRDEPRSGRPVEAATEETIEAVKQLILMDTKIKVEELAAETKVSHGTICSILDYHLHVQKVCARWVPRNLSVFDKKNRLEISKSNLEQITQNEEMFYNCIVTGDETFIHHYDPESKWESKEWRHRGSPPPIKFRVQPSAGKIMATIFWDAQGILMIDYLPHKQHITGSYYADLMTKLREAVKEKRRGKLTRGVLLLHDNASSHKSKVAMAAIANCGFQVLEHPAYSPDLAPCDYYLFPNLKKHLRGKRFMDDSEVMSAVNEYFESCDNMYFLTGLKMLQQRYVKCIEMKGSYVEK